MSEAEKYSDYQWVKVKRADVVEIDGVKYVSEDHHIAETNFLIEEIRILAKRIDDLTYAYPEGGKFRDISGMTKEELEADIKEDIDAFKKGFAQG